MGNNEAARSKFRSAREEKDIVIRIRSDLLDISNDIDLKKALFKAMAIRATNKRLRLFSFAKAHDLLGPDKYSKIRAPFEEIRKAKIRELNAKEMEHYEKMVEAAKEFDFSECKGRMGALYRIHSVENYRLTEDPRSYAAMAAEIDVAKASKHGARAYICVGMDQRFDSFNSYVNVDSDIDIEIFRMKEELSDSDIRDLVKSNGFDAWPFGV